MGALETGRIAELLLDKTVESFEADPTLLSLVDFEEHDPEKMLLSGNAFWRPVAQQSVVVEGFRLTSSDASGIIVPTIPYTLGTPRNTVTSQYAEDLRTTKFWEDKAQTDGVKLRSTLNQDIGEYIRDEGSIFFDSAATSGFDFVDEVSLFYSERQLPGNEKHLVFNPRDLSKFASDLAARQTVEGRPEDAWKMGNIGPSVSDINLHKATSNPHATGAADPAITVDGNQSFKPEAGTVADSVVTNIDHRNASILFNTTTGLARGDKFTLENAGTTVKAIKRDVKDSSGQAMIFTVKSITSATVAVISPKPIAYDDAGLTDHEKEYANIDTQILTGATLTRLNTDASVQTNLIFDRKSVKVIGGTIPANLFKEFAGKKVISRTMESGLVMYIIYDGDILDLSFTFRCFTWWGVNIPVPDCCGYAITSTV